MGTSQTKFRPREAADYLQIAISTLAKMRSRGDGPPFAKASGRLIIYDRAELDAWLTSLHNLASSSCPKPTNNPSK